LLSLYHICVNVVVKVRYFLDASVTAGVIRLIEIKDPEKVEDRKNMSYEEFQQYYFGKCIIPIGFGLFGVLFLYGYKMSLG